MSGRLASAAAAALVAAALALVPGSEAQDAEPGAAPHLAGSAGGALLGTPPADPRAAGAPGWPLPANPRQVSTRAQASTTGFDGDPATSRASASAGGASAERSAGPAGPATAGDAERGPFASALAQPVDAAGGTCPPAAADGTRTISEGLARADGGAALGPVAVGPGGATRSTVSLVPAAGQDGLAVRSSASASIGSVRIGDAYELRVVREPRLVAEATGTDGGASISWRAPIVDVVELATGASVARLDERHASFRTSDESESGGRNQPFRVALVAPDERIASPDGGFARARAALVRIRFQPSLDLGEVTVGALEASATAPVGGVTTCDGGAALPQERSRPHVLVYEGNNGFEHVSRHEANRTIARLANESGAFSVEFTDQATFLRDDRLAGVDMVMFNNNVGNMPVDGAQRDALERHLLAGGGAGGIHSATDANYSWDEYGELFGARFDGHPHMGYMPEWGSTRVVVEDEASPITSGWHDAEVGADGRRSFRWADEYYRWREQDVPALRADPDVNVLLSLDTKTVHPGTQQGFNPYGAYRVEFQPIAWTKTFRGAGRVFYTNMGHNGFAWAHPEFRTMVLEGIRWVTAEP
jgi:uncharacterized protein